MTKTFTPDLEFTAKLTEAENDVFQLPIAEPSFNVIQSILNFSKNLEVKNSNSVGIVEYLRS